MQLSLLSRLKYLDLCQCEQVTDVTLSGMQALTTLEVLLLAHTQVCGIRRRHGGCIGLIHIC